VQATNGFPLLQRIAVYYGKTIGYADTLGNALKDLSLDPSQAGSTLIGGATNTPAPTTTPTTTPGTTTPTNSPTSPTSPSSTPSSSSTAAQLLAQINNAYSALQTCQGATSCATAQQNLNTLIATYLAKYGPKK
jgi:uncharacterized membrane protein (UPF0182 family)